MEKCHTHNFYRQIFSVLYIDDLVKLPAPPRAALLVFVVNALVFCSHFNYLSGFQTCSGLPVPDRFTRTLNPVPNKSSAAT